MNKNNRKKRRIYKPGGSWTCLGWTKFGFTVGGEILDDVDEELDDSSVDLLLLNLCIEVFCWEKLLLEFVIGFKEN